MLYARSRSRVGLYVAAKRNATSAATGYNALLPVIVHEMWTFQYISLIALTSFEILNIEILDIHIQYTFTLFVILHNIYF